jgi:signal transduction histidine kinase
MASFIGAIQMPVKNWAGWPQSSREQRKLPNLPLINGRLGAFAVGTERVLYWLNNQENKVAQPATEENKKLKAETVTQLRTLSHDLSNYIETIMQASYLLAQAKLDDPNQKWLELIDKASQDAARINREIREILRAQS